MTMFFTSANTRGRLGKSLAMLALAIIFAFSVVSQSWSDMHAGHENVPREQTLVFDPISGRIAFPDFWNPYGYKSGYSIDFGIDHGFHQAMIEPLFVLDYESGKLTPWLATDYRFNTTHDRVRITLRTGVKWSDGEAMDADDLVFTINMLKQNPGLKRSLQVINWVDSVVKVDRLTAEIKLLSPNPEFVVDHLSLKISSGLHVLPEHIWRDKDPISFSNYAPEKGWPVFTGPYRLVQSSTYRTVLMRNDDWWGAQAGFMPLPKPKKLVWAALGSSESRVAAMAANQLDSLMDISIDEFKRLTRDNPDVIAYHDGPPYAWRDPCPRYLEFNTQREPWSDKALRWAINHAIDREQLVKRGYEGKTVASTHVVPDYETIQPYLDFAQRSGLYDRYPLHVHDPSRAKLILKSRGYQFNAESGFFEKDGQPLSLHVQIREGGFFHSRVAEIMIRQMRRVGIDASFGIVAEGLYWRNLENHTFQAHVGGARACGSVYDPHPTMQKIGEIHAKMGKPIKTEDGDYNTILNKMQGFAKQSADFNQQFLAASEVLFEQLPIIPLVQTGALVPFNTHYWTNWPTADNPYSVPATWWQSTHQMLHKLKSVERPKSEPDKKIDTKITLFVSLPDRVKSGEEDRALMDLNREVVERLVQRLGVRIATREYPWARAYQMAQRRKDTLIYPVDRLLVNDDSFKWVGTISPSVTHVYQLSRAKSVVIKHPHDFHPYQIAVVRNSGAEQYLRMFNHPRLWPITAVEQGIAMLEKGRVDLLITDEFQFDRGLASTGTNPELFKSAMTIDELSIDSFLAFSPSTSDRLVDRFRKALAEMKISGEYDELMSRYASSQ